MMILHTIDAAAAVALGGLLADLTLERARLRQFVEEFHPHPEDPRALALEVAGRLFTLPHREDPAYLGLPPLAPLGSSPGALIQGGGSCSGLSRLYIHCLSKLGMRAHQVTLYHHSGHAQHCLVEANLPDGPLVVDPICGIFYTNAAGGPIGLDDLQTGTTPHFAPLPHSDRHGYPRDDYYAFTFALSKTVNWTKSCSRRLAYRLLATITRGGVDRFHMPTILEWPQVLLAALLVWGLVAVHLVVFGLQRGGVA
jgi:hypothetical protein